MQYFLGVDGGATKTKAVIINQNKKIVGEGEDKGSNLNVTNPKVALANIIKATKKALSGKQFEITSAYFALTGVNTEIDRKFWQSLLAKNSYFSNLLDKRPYVANDIVAALRSATAKKNAIALIAGTGSNCWGINESGKSEKSGGADYILSDQGSAYDIGLHVLKAVTSHLDGRGPKTSLADLLLRQFKIDTLDDLLTLVYKKPWGKTDIAKVAPLAEIAAKKNDKVAKLIIKDAARELAKMIKAVAQKLNLTNKSYSIVTTGSVFKIQKILCSTLEKEVLKFSPKARFVTPKIDSATAAAYLAFESVVARSERLML